MWLTLLLSFFLIQLLIRKPLNYSQWQNNGIILARRKSRRYDGNNMDISWNIPSLFLIVNFLMFGYQVKHCFSCLIYILSLIRYEISAPILGVCISDETLRIILAYEILHTNMWTFFSSEILDKCREKWDEFVWGKNPKLKKAKNVELKFCYT